MGWGLGWDGDWTQTCQVHTMIHLREGLPFSKCPLNLSPLLQLLDCTGARATAPWAYGECVVNMKKYGANNNSFRIS